MSWREITEDDVLTALSGPERNAVENAAKAAGQASPMASLIASTVAELRGRVAKSPGIKLGPAPTMPESVIQQAVVIIRYRLLSRLPSASLITEARTNEWKEALAYFRDVSAGDVSIELPGPEEDSRATPMVDVVASQERVATRGNMSGI